MYVFAPLIYTVIIILVLCQGLAILPQVNILLAHMQPYYSTGSSNMATSNLQLRLSYLKDAAHLLAVAAPETSAYLMSERDRLARKNTQGPHPLIEPEKHCGACGHVFLSSQVIFIKTAHAGRKPGKSGKRRDKGGLAWKCSRCGKLTRTWRSSSRRARREQQLPAAKAPTSETPSSNMPVDVNVSRSSKKQAKKRKRREGLLMALVQENQARGRGGRGSSGLGLTLSDFMKK